MSKRIEIQKNEIILLFNALAALGYDRNLKISIPMINDIKLFKFDLEADHVQVSNFISETHYKKNLNIVTDRIKNNKARQEIPVYGDIVQSFYQSGILKSNGLEELEQIIANLKNQVITKGGDVYYIALDTNLLRERFYSVFLSKIPFCRNLDFILCETVRDEMKNRSGKTDKKFLNDMHPIPRHLVQECFMNQNTLEDRKRYIGFSEYNHMRSITSCEEIDAPSKKSSMKNDQYILNAYSNFVDIGRKVIFISKDNEAVRMMTGEENVIPVCLESNKLPKSKFKSKWNNFFDFIYILGILFGKLDVLVGGISTASFYGVWRGKDVKEWEDERMLLKIYNHGTADKKDLQEYQLLCKRINDNISVLYDIRKIQKNT